MTHEPECDAATLSVKGHEFNLPCICEVARAAYQRGRHDALVEVWRWTAQKERAARREDKNV